MALADPQSITYATVATSLPRTGQSMAEGKFADVDRKFQLQVTHTNSSRFRHSVQLRLDDVVSNPLVPDQNVATFATVGLTINAPRNGLSNTQVTDLAKALVAWATAANLLKLVTGES